MLNRETGQLITGSFMDYVMPRADTVPNFESAVNENAITATNPIGVKGAGEAGCVGAMPALMNAIVDELAVELRRCALSPYRAMNCSSITDDPAAVLRLFPG